MPKAKSKISGDKNASEDVLIMRMIAASELSDAKPWMYDENEKDGTMQAMRFIAAQQFLLSWQSGKVSRDLREWVCVCA